ncbi:Linear gramicidin synthase subunit A [Arsenophonus endosymbiont of Aleurodicus floccissimus]|uniref:hypothetical protein n=1 Tax=Arsenophonus endosymbiont of Aleurodicus floccissimus TaxID=2152761 RepID=UPI000EEE17F0|nr:Linear gramicidin synthase subunit A [Arsenophonus endosymbiont of Aleurodicus floccissimus]
MHVWPCYQNNPSANQQKFCQLSLNGQHQLAYLTGDIGHYDKQGRLNYLERRDYQIKINGYRLECGQWLPAGALKMEFRLVDALSTIPSGKINRAGLAGLLWYPLPDDNLSAQPIIKRQATN